VLKLFWGGFSDTQVTASRDVIQKIEKVIQQFKPDMLLSPYHDDTHQDHRATARATITASRYVSSVLFFEVPTTVNFVPTIFVDIGNHLSIKFKLLKAHRSQVYRTKVPGLSILEASKSNAIYRGTQMHAKFAEGFVPYRLILDHKL